MPATLTIADRSLSVAATEGIRHLQDADWSASTRPTEEFLAVLALRLVLVGYLVGSVTRTTNADGATMIAVSLPANDTGGERLAAAKLLLAPLGIYADMAGISIEKRASDTGVIPIPVLIVGGVVAVSFVAAQAYVVMYVADKAGEITDRVLKRQAAASEIQRADAEVLKLVNLHVQREQASGQTLALDEATKFALGGLQSRVGSLVQLGYQSEQNKGFPSWALPAMGLAALAVVTAIVFLRKGQHNV
jgi:hypothetical protein